MAASILTHRHSTLTELGIPQVLRPILFVTSLFVSLGVGFAIALSFAKL